MSGTIFGILGEDESDGHTIAAIVHKLTGDDRVRHAVHDFRGSGNLLNKGHHILSEFHRAKGCRKFIVCMDADLKTVDERLREAHERIVKPTGLAHHCCIVVPVQEIEAWILADIDEAIKRWRPSSQWKPTEEKSPEAIQSPKEYLKRLSRTGAIKPRYQPATNNPQVARYLDLKRVERKCPSFRVLREFAELKTSS